MPGMTQTRYLRNRWYVGALASKITDRPFACRLLGEPIVLFRPSSGEVVALEDRCIHRQAPLSLGEVVGDRLQCGYHGFEYDTSGACVRIPTQSRIPPGAGVRSYPVREHQGFVHIWTGDPALCDTVPPYDFPYAADPAWRARYARFHGRFDHRLLLDNLMDITHLPYAHKTTIGAAGVAEDATAKTERDGEHVRITRYMENIAPAPAHVAVTGYTDNVDRWQIIEFTPPGFVWLQVGSARAGKGGRNAAPEDILLNRHTLHVMMPETDETTLYFWAMANETDALTPEQEDSIYDASMQAFNEDIVIIEGQQDRWNPDQATIDVGADAGVLDVRRLMERLIAEETDGIPGTKLRSV
jgi:phenylpropionate dioxygenase-like ring-hydroxylating dioxygenase large terminal subunit